MTTYDPGLYQALVLRTALKARRDHGIQVNRAYTPKAMLATASRITGKAFRPRDYSGAIDALTEWLEGQSPSSI